MKLTKKGQQILQNLLKDMGEPVELICTYSVRKGAVRGYDEHNYYKPIYWEHGMSYIRYYIPRVNETWEYIEEHDTGKVLADHKLQDDRF